MVCRVDGEVYVGVEKSVTKSLERLIFQRQGYMGSGTMSFPQSDNYTLILRGSLKIFRDFEESLQIQTGISHPYNITL